MANAKNILVGCALTLSACGSSVESHQVDAITASDAKVEDTGAALCGNVKELDIRRSLVVTEQPILLRFSFQRVMEQLVSQAHVPGLTAKTLFNRWWDTQNPVASSTFSDVQHCDAQVDETLGSVINGFPYSCRPAPSEGAEASCDPFTDDACKYIPIGLFNRFDLAPADGSSCGEYRIVFAKASGQTTTNDRNLLIFEASLPNPEPYRGLKGCRSIVSFWGELSGIDSMDERAKRLEKFYFRGLPGVSGPVVDIKNYGDNRKGRGQVRTNQFVQSAAKQWSLREFKLMKQCKTSGCKQNCSLSFVPVTDKTNPFGELFSASSTHPKAQAFQDMFVSQVETLAADSLMDISMEIPDTFNTAQSHSSGSNEMKYLVNFGEGGALGTDIDSELHTLGSDLTAANIVARAQTQTCAGCHQISNQADLGDGLKWPSSLKFVHVSEKDPETTTDGVVRYRISDALSGTFLPHRKDIMTKFLRGQHVRMGYATTH
jgi:hypothetical protein